jgi:hypothetical protein
VVSTPASLVESRLISHSLVGKPTLRGSKKNIRAKKELPQDGSAQILNSVSLASEIARKFLDAITSLVVVVLNGVGFAGRRMQIFGRLGIRHIERVAGIMPEL